MVAKGGKDGLELAIIVIFLCGFLPPPRRQWLNYQQGYSWYLVHLPENMVTSMTLLRIQLIETCRFCVSYFIRFERRNVPYSSTFEFRFA